jgi:serine/threonine protein kinase
MMNTIGINKENNAPSNVGDNANVKGPRVAERANASIFDILSCVPKTLTAAQERASLIFGLGIFRLDQIISEENADGKHLGSYKLGKILGQGRFGQVVAATDSSGKPVAIKTIPLINKRGSDPVMEVNLMKSHGMHPNIMPLQDTLLSENHCYLVMPRATMDLATLGTRTDLIDKQPDLLQQATRGFLWGLHHLHEQGVAHMDIKMENVLLCTKALDFDGNLMLGRRITSKDFKLSNLGSALMCPRFHPNVICEMAKENAVPVKCRRGSLRTMAPDVVWGGCPDGRLADMWSVGSMLLIFLGEFRGANKTILDLWQELPHLISERNSREYSIVVKQFVEALVDFRAVTRDQQIFHHFLTRLCVLDPLVRMTSGKALAHKFLECTD